VYRGVVAAPRWPRGTSSSPCAASVASHAVSW
jgi:hypothetical protein